MSENPSMTSRDQIEALLPFYLNGTLEGEELQQVEHWLANSTEAASALEEAEAELAADIAINEAIELPRGAASRFAESLGAERNPEPVSVSGLFGSFFSWLFARPPQIAWAAAALALCLAVVTPFIFSTPAQQYNTATAPGQTKKVPYVFATFDDQASIADINELMNDVGIHIIDGPTAEGRYKIAIPVESIGAYEAVLSLLMDDALVREVMDGRKPKDE